MARVEWAALGGDEAEAVISNLLYNEYPRAARIRPSQGDFGIDVLVPSETHPETSDVYQIKKFATNLTDSQKGQIKKSFRRLMVGLVRKGIRVGDWYLVMPLDPTLEALEWFEKIPDSVIKEMFADPELALTKEEKEAINAWKDADGRIIEWKGHLFCEGLVSKFWYVPDYYLHGGSERIRSAVAQIARILDKDLSLRGNVTTPLTSLLTPAELRAHLGHLNEALKGDPHFLYGVSIDPVAPPLLDEPGLIAATQEVASDGSCVTFRIYARFAEALNERPVPMRLRFEFQDGASEAFEQWRKYGKPFTSPASFELDLPGGLGGRSDGGTVRISPPGDGETSENRYRVVSPAEDVLGEVSFRLTVASGLDGTGRWMHGSDASNFLSVEALVDINDRSLQATFSSKDITGASPAEVLPALNFMAGLTSPNKLQVAARYGPFHDLDALPDSSPEIPPVILRYIHSLAVMQEYTATPIVIPDLARTTMGQVRDAIRTASLLQGQTVVYTWKPFRIMPPADGIEVVPDGQYQLAFPEPIYLTVDEGRISLGVADVIILSAKLARQADGAILVHPHSNNTAHKAMSRASSSSGEVSAPVKYRKV
ncbi:hypothetical protein ACFCWB_24010 [Streptomyces bacillaris]|uniref:hypothetical protein n=1 Tax=Streptomyces bacillaris TaxID=68179 RepID=UPI0035DD92EB